MIIEDHDILVTDIDDDDEDDDTEHASEYVHVMSAVRSIVTRTEEQRSRSCIFAGFLPFPAVKFNCLNISLTILS